MTDKDIYTTAVMDNLFSTLRQYSQSRKVIDTEIFRQRARQYAQQTEKETHAPDELLTLLTFKLGSELYGLDVMTVKSVRPIPAITRVPGAHPFYRGVTNVRGAVITVLDLRLFFGLSRSEDIRELIVVDTGKLTLGIAAQRVHEVINFPRTNINLLDDSRFLVGVYPSEHGRIAVLDTQELFTDPRLQPNDLNNERDL